MSFEITKTIRRLAFKTFEIEIIERTPRTLKLEAKGDVVRFSMLSTSLLFVGIGLGIMIYGPNKLTTLKCERLNQTEVTCELTSSSLIEEHITPIPVGEFQGAELIVSKNKKGQRSYRATLLTKAKDIPLYGIFYWSEEVADERVQEINNFVSNPKQILLIIQQDNRRFIYASIGILALLGSLAIVNALTKKVDVTCIFDAEADRMYLKQQNIFKKSEIREEILYEIKEAQIVVVKKTGKKTDTKYNIEPQIVVVEKTDTKYNIKLILSSGNEITLLPINILYNPYKITQSINHFLEYQSRKKS
jgi:hypothetical protein